MSRAVFFCHYAADPYFNMAFDEWLLGRALAEPDFMALRLYTWQPGAITFGFNQKKEMALDFSQVAETPVIRRMTGGRAIYHDPGELTYSIVANIYGLNNGKLAGSLGKTSRTVGEALTCFLAGLGIKAHLRRRSSPKESQSFFLHTAACFDSVARHEIVANEKKIVASAQRRIGHAFLQHGSIKINGIAAHPALRARSLHTPPSVSLPIITKEEFDARAASFFDAMGLSLDLACFPGRLDSEDRSRIEKQTAHVKKNPLMRRAFF